MDYITLGYNLAVGKLSQSPQLAHPVGNSGVKSNNIISDYFNSEPAFKTNENGSKFTDIIQYAANKYGLPKELISNVINAESSFNPNSKSSSGAMGLMQLMPDTAKSLGVNDPYDPFQNVMGGVKYLKSLMDEFKDVKLALAAYNAGPGNVKKYGGVPPFTETQNYVKKILGNK